MPSCACIATPCSGGDPPLTGTRTSASARAAHCRATLRPPGAKGGATESSGDNHPGHNQRVGIFTADKALGDAVVAALEALHYLAWQETFDPKEIYGAMHEEDNAVVIFDEALGYLRDAAGDRTSGKPLIIALAQAGDEQKYMDAGAAAVLTKPVAASDIVAAVRAQLEKP